MASLYHRARRLSGKLTAEDARAAKDLEHRLRIQIARLNDERDDAYRLALEGVRRRIADERRPKSRRKASGDPELLARYHALKERTRETDQETDWVMADADRLRTYLREKYALR